MTDIPKLNYLSLGEVFKPMFERAIGLLEVVIAERYIEIPLTAHQNQYFSAEVRQPSLLACDLFLAVTSTGISEAELRESLPRLLKLASSEHLGQLINVAGEGVRVTLEHQPPAALPIKPGVLFFRVDKSGKHWRAITTSGALSLWLPFPKVKPALYAVDPSTLQ